MTMPETRDEILERAERLDLALAHAGMNATALANALGITSASLSEIKKGKSKAPERWRQIAEKLSVDADWLMRGAGCPPAWATDSNVVYGIAISSRDDRMGINDAVSVARALYERNAHGLVDSLFFDTGVGHLFLREKPGISESDRDRICEALSRLDGSSALVEYGSEYYPDPNEPRDRGGASEAEAQAFTKESEAVYRADSPDLEGAPPWAIRLLDEVHALRAEVAELRRGRTAAPRSGAADEIARIMDTDEHPRPQAPTYPRPASVPGRTPHGR